MADDPMAAILLIGMGIDSLSMSAGSLGRIKWVVRTFSRTAARRLLQDALLLEEAHQIRLLLTNALDQNGLGGLVRAGM
jgi:phosphotransferase system enzyme I (PtsP)